MNWEAIILVRFPVSILSLADRTLYVFLLFALNQTIRTTQTRGITDTTRYFWNNLNFFLEMVVLKDSLTTEGTYVSLETLPVGTAGLSDMQFNRKE